MPHTPGHLFLATEVDDTCAPPVLHGHGLTASVPPLNLKTNSDKFKYTHSHTYRHIYHCRQTLTRRLQSVHLHIHSHKHCSTQTPDGHTHTSLGKHKETHTCTHIPTHTYPIKTARCTYTHIRAPTVVHLLPLPTPQPLAVCAGL